MPIQVDAYLDPLTGDLPATSRLCTGMELVQQRVRIRMRRGLGEWFLDPSEGLDLLGWRQQKPPPVQSILAAVQAEIRRVPGVTSTANFQGVHDGPARRLTITGDVFVGEVGVTSLVATVSTGAERNTMHFSLFFSSRSIQGTPAQPFRSL